MITGIAVVAGLALLLVGMLHVVWAASPWPLGTRAQFAEVIVGRPAGEELPAVFATLSVVVGVLLAAGAYLVVAEAGLVPGVLGDGWIAAGTWVVAAVLLVRGVYGLVESGLGLSVAEATYRRLDLRAYSPLCLVLGALTAVVALA
ncbi:DUF3995 domain-containing protein [Nocardioides sp. InS609-2]|uniref:DUF3995 domain-containing protein n=1 Tax=Nocardioides sp. InS609-2 TaxID=2760705 RepID=UPI0020BE5984|nr:DUF3995 domain-containing protein [Nocardioides sp. InS609-2]